MHFKVGLIGTTDAYAMGLARNFQAECDKAKIKVIPDINNMPSFTIHEKGNTRCENCIHVFLKRFVSVLLLAI